MLSFPTSTPSTEAWLETLKMGKYKAAFDTAGVTVEELHLLTDERLQSVGVQMVGHRKRLLQASKELQPPQGAPQAMDTDMDTEATSTMPPPMSTSGAAAGVVEQMSTTELSAADKEAKRFNSTSSMFINSTIMKPDIDEIIFCVAVVIHDRIIQGETMDADARRLFPFFSEENNPLYAEPAAAGDSGGETEKKKAKREVPAEETIYHTIRSVYECARFPSECLIVSLVYMERLIAFSHVPILVTSWRPILLAGLILAQKVWDDRSLHNVDFSTFCPMFTLKEINHLEKKFLELIDYDVSISSSLYASYYFQLRTLCQRENRSFSLKPMDVETSAQLEARGLAYQAKLKKDAGRTWQSANDADRLSHVAGKPGGFSGFS